MLDTIEEEWRDIVEFPLYKVSNLGRVYSIQRDHIMSTSLTTFGHAKITLKSEWSRERFTRGVAQLVAEAFVAPPNLDVDHPSQICDHVVVLNGDLSNVATYNLVWRPRWFAWKYAHQFNVRQPLHYRNLPVMDVDTGEEYESVVEAGISEGLLFADVWRSTYTGASLYPTGSIFEIVK